MRVSRLGALVAGVAVLLAAGCGSDDDKDTASEAKGPKTYEVQVDGNRDDLGLKVPQFMLAYYPKAVSVHPGDSISFGLNDSGEPHTVALGTLVEASAGAYLALPEAERKGEPPAAIEAAFKKVPELLPQGPGDAIQAGAQPCYQATGNPPLKDACSVKTGEFSGSEALVTSGWLDPNAPFTLKIADTAKPGKYTFFCQLHGADMSGTLTIADKTTTVPSPADVKKTGAAELQADTTALSGAADALAKATPDKALAGSGLEGFERGVLNAFAPAQMSIPVGGSVTWNVLGPHSIFFNAPADAQQLRAATPDGAVHLNAKAAAPLGGPGQGPKPGLINGGTWDGTGARSSGLILSFPPDLYSYKLTFSKAGTYDYICSVHVGMKGTVTVG